MKVFTPAIVSYIQDNRVCVLAVQMPDGTPHAAAVHYAYNGESFIFETYQEYRKMEAFTHQEIVRVSLVIGSTEGDMRTLQIDGSAQLIARDDERVSTYMHRFPEKQGKYDADKLVFFICNPSWWRFTDWTHADGKRVEMSE